MVTYIFCGKKLSHLRKDRGLTQKEFGELVGIHQQEVSTLEKTKRQPNSNLLFDICYVLGVDNPFSLSRKVHL